jgi:hypothetical protein
VNLFIGSSGHRSPWMQRTTVQAPIKNLASLVGQRRNFDPRVDEPSVSDHLFFSKSVRGHAATSENLLISEVF